ncbi:glycosyl transferase [Paenibacillus sp. sptzw28]|uniref:macrolide family glycosyltransferase n=1 Tax=Paenibacillus sp. sptzw28 TaxID=715179 RepID=UPI001C6DFA96|nr:macrolide family glycosyltransferase [Paenibacillus sp. sptzw28]QYR23216.1 glycosyl transferase [Paenibacillus sp. sptzw28]
MGKVLFISFPAEGHVNPTVGLVKELTKKGEQVTYYCVENFRERMEGAGAEVRTYDNFISQDLINKVGGRGPDSNMDPLAFMEFLLRKSDELVKSILPAVQNEKYDYVIYDHMCIAGWMIAEILKLPKICSCTTFAIHPDGDDPIKKMFQTGPREAINLKIEEWVRLMKSEYELDLTFLLKPAGVFIHPVDMTLVYTSSSFQPNAEKFDDSYHFVGPSITDRKGVPEFSALDIKGSKIIYISMGTVFNQLKEYYQMCFEAFKDFDAEIVMSVGKNTDLSEFSTIPDNFIIKNYVPQLEVLQIADVFFTHGGMNSTSEGLYFGTPLAVIPVSADQPLIARRVAELKAGIALNLDEVSPALLRETAQKLLTDPSYKEHAEEIGASFRKAGGAPKAADVILEWSHALFQA